MCCFAILKFLLVAILPHNLKNRLKIFFLCSRSKLFFLKGWVCIVYTPLNYFSLSGITRNLTSFGRLPIKSVEVFSMNAIFWGILLYGSAIASQLKDNFHFQYTLSLPFFSFFLLLAWKLICPACHLSFFLSVSVLLPCFSGSLHRLQMSSCPCSWKAPGLFWKKTWGS